MPQISLYVDEKTLKQVEREAREARLSVSRFVATVLHEKFDHQWSDSFLSLFGAVKDDSFLRPEDGSEDQDMKRMQL